MLGMVGHAMLGMVALAMFLRGKHNHEKWGQKLTSVTRCGVLNHEHVCQMMTYIIYMVIDLKVLVRSFNCESRACYVGNSRESFFSSSRK